MNLLSNDHPAKSGLTSGNAPFSSTQKLPMSKTHTLKCQPEYFRATKRGEKTFEIRRNDRDFQVGDTVTLLEFDGNEPTGRELRGFVITYIFHGPGFGLSEGYCVLQLK